MKGILKLVLCCVRHDKKKTFRMILGVALSVISFILCSNIIMAGNQLTRLFEIQENGSYQVRFFDVTKEQAEQIEEQENVSNCIWIQEGEVSYADVKLKKVDKEFFSNCYEIADTLPLEKENISFHNDLLATYGVKSEDHSGMTIYQMGFFVLIVISILFAVFLYNLFEFFLYDNKKYLGILEAIGATSLQKKMYVLLEALLVGSIGIIVGIAAGTFICFGLSEVLGQMLVEKYEWLAEFEYHLSFETIIISVFCSYVMLLLSCMLPLIKAGRVSAVTLMKTDGDTAGKNIPDKAQFLPKRSVWYNLVRREFLWKRTKYLKIFLVFITTFILAGYCFVWIGIQKGEYLVRDKRLQNKPDQMISINTENLEAAGSVLGEIQKLPHVENAQLTMQLYLSGIVIDKDQVEGKDEFTITGTSMTENPVTVTDTKGQRAEGIGMNAVCIGLDDHTFQTYADKIGSSGEQGVIIEDYLLTDQTGKQEFGSILKRVENKKWKMSYSKYGDMSFFLPEKNQVDEILSKEFDVLGITSEKPDLPQTKEDYECHVLNYGQVSAGTINIYMPADQFCRLAESEDFKYMVGEHPKDTVALEYLENNEIGTVIYYDCPEKYREEILNQLFPIMETYGLKKLSIDEGKKDSWYYTSREMIDRQHLVSVDGKLKIVLYYGILGLLILFCFTGLFQFFYMEQKENLRRSALLEMIGTEMEGQKQMLRIKYGLFAVSTMIIGIIVEVWLLSLQFSDASRYQTLERRFPVTFLAGECVFVVLFFVVMYVIGKRTIKKNDVTKSLRCE